MADKKPIKLPPQRLVNTQINYTGRPGRLPSRCSQKLIARAQEATDCSDQSVDIRKPCSVARSRLPRTTGAGASSATTYANYTTYAISYFLCICEFKITT